MISDKAGEVWAIDMPFLRNKVKLLGHTASVITDMKLTANSNYLITSDRDEKIRITNFPQVVKYVFFFINF
jgi:tRNA (guanine-N(7)-)-methyltransferase subunit TRM82